MRTTHELVCKLCYSAEAWLVGSAADSEVSNPRDWDVLVPFSYWHVAASRIPCDAVPNAFGGWKCMSEGQEVDVWPGDLSLLLTYGDVTHAFHKKTGKRWSCVS